jgi:hypothetical protein
MTSNISSSLSAMAAGVFCKHFGGKRDEEDRRGSRLWREEVAGILSANLTNLDAISHGFVPSHVQRMTGF